MCSLLYDRQSCSPWFDGSLHINSIESVCISLRHSRAVIYLNKIYSSLQIFLTEDCVCAIISSIMPGLSRFSDEEIIRMKRLHFIEGKVTVLSRKLSIATDQAIDSARLVAYEHVSKERAAHLL